MQGDSKEMYCAKSPYITWPNTHTSSDFLFPMIQFTHFLATVGNEQAIKELVALLEMPQVFERWIEWFEEKGD